MQTANMLGRNKPFLLLFLVVWVAEWQCLTEAFSVQFPPIRTRRQRRTIHPLLRSTTTQSSNEAHTQLSLSGNDTLQENLWRDNRPHEQRVKAPRPARRLNSVFRYLYRHNIPDEIETMDPLTYLTDYAGYRLPQVMTMNQSFPPLLTLSVQRQLHPKLRFLQETLLSHTHETVQTAAIHNNENITCANTEATTLSILPPQYFGARLERILAPRHAFLVHHNLTHGPELVQDAQRWDLFLKSARKPKNFAALCQSWQREKGDKDKDSTSSINVKMIEAFDALFGRGLMAAARNELVQHNNTWPLQHINISASEMIQLLIQHGANERQLDHRGVSLLHWAAGTGHLEAIPVLLAPSRQPNSRQHSKTSSPSLSIFDTRTLRDGATALHWAAAGAKAREFGCGGHVHVCQYLLDQIPSRQRKEYLNVLTKDGNSALMWAAWSGTLDTVKLLVRHRAQAHHSNRNGCTVAHWAASGGNVQVCRYLYEIAGVDFTTPNHGGNTPLTHAVAFGRREVVEWLRESVLCGNNGESDEIAYHLARDFVQWTDGDEKRQQVLQLFQDWYAMDDESNDEDDNEEEEEEEFF